MAKPVVNTLLLCENVITDARTRANTLVNVFNRIVANEFPVVIRGYVFIILGDGKGEEKLKCQVRRLDTDDYDSVGVLLENVVRFEDSIIPTQLSVDFIFEAVRPGVFAVELHVGNEYLSSVKLQVAERPLFNKE